MRAPIILMVVALAQPIEAQTQTPQPRWEYGRLTATAAGALTIPTSWTAGDSTFSTDSLMRVFALNSKSGQANRSVDPLLYVMNELGRQGWEFVQAVPQFGFIFKRRRE